MNSRDQTVHKSNTTKKIFVIITLVFSSVSYSFADSPPKFEEKWLHCNKDSDCIAIKSECDGPSAYSKKFKKEAQALHAARRNNMKNYPAALSCSDWIDDPWKNATTFCVDSGGGGKFCTMKYPEGKNPRTK